MSTIFETILYEAEKNGICERGEDAKKWFERQVERLASSTTQRSLIEGGANFEDDVRIGHFYQFMYKPKNSKKLRFWDAFPLALVLDNQKESFLSINFHYLSPKTRVFLLGKLDRFASNREFNRGTNLKITYDLLKKSNLYKEGLAAITKYLKKNIKSKILRIDSSEWEIAIFLPTEDFQKKSKRDVWIESEKRK